MENTNQQKTLCFPVKEKRKRRKKDEGGERN